MIACVRWLRARVGDLLVHVVWRTLVAGPALKVLVGQPVVEGSTDAARFQRAHIQRLLLSGWQRYQVLAQDLPKEPSISGTVSVLAAAMLFALMQVLVASGLDRAYAARLVGEISWVAYQQSFGKAGPSVLRRVAPDPLKRVRLAMHIGLRYQFTEPSYRHRRVPVAGGDGFDMLRCPIADYLAPRGASDLCMTAFCAVDYRVFELVGMRLERSGTISSGAELCDFRAFPVHSKSPPRTRS